MGFGHGLQDVPGKHTARKLQSCEDRLANAAKKLKRCEAVVDAAKAYVRAIQTIEPRVVRERYLSYQAEPWHELREAVKALEATEAPGTPPDATG